MRTCRKCRVEKPLTEFVRLSTAKDGFRNLCKVCHNDNMTAYLHKYPEREKSKKLRYNYNITLAEYNSLLKTQNNKCKICRIDFSTISLRHIHVDHCHRTNKVRGILCHSCNTTLGLIKENKDTIKNMLIYLEDN